MARITFSLVVISFQEAKNIERCLKSVPFADDVVVLDSGSQDGTVALAKSLGARVFVENWRGYREQKQRAVELAKYDWILSLDADEALSSELAARLEDVLCPAELNNADGFEFSRLSFYLGRPICHGGWYPDWQLRLFHRARAQWQGGSFVHERVQARRVSRINESILHWPFADIDEQVATNNRYSKLGAQELSTKGVHFSLSKLIMKPVSKFIETWLLKRGFLDGLPGFIISVGAAYSVFLKFAKLWELQKFDKAAVKEHQEVKKHQNETATGPMSGLS